MSLQPDKTGKHPSGRIIEFYEEEHIYTIKGEPEIEFTSATTWISQFFPEFDRERISKNYALKHNMHQEDVLAMWDKKARIARERGTLVHAKAEDSILYYQEKGYHIELDKVLTPADSDGVSDDPGLTRTLINSMHQAVVKMSEVLEFIRPECVIASPDLRLSGMVDLMVKLKSSNGSPLIGLYDWKTNQQIETHNQWQNGFTPINHLADCNFNHYSLQLNLYEYILRREKYFSEDTRFQKVLIHLHQDGYKTYKCPDLQHNIEAMLEVDTDRTNGLDL